METHPVQLHVERPAAMQRIHVLIRLVLLLALGTVGCSSLYWLLYLALPAAVALYVSQKGGERYLSDGAPRIVRALRWIAGAYAYLWLLTDAFPTSESGAAVALEVEAGGAPRAGSALLRLLYSLPPLLLLAILSFVACILWLVGVLAILLVRRTPAAIADFLAMTLRYQFRLVAYHLSLVDRYPALSDVSAPRQAASGAG